jgi:hypothetical protein
MFAGGKNAAVVISFPDLSPAEASILAKELSQELSLLDGVAADQIALLRSSDDAQDLCSILAIAAGSGLAAGLIELAKDAGKELVKGAFNRAGQKALDAILPILRKRRARAKVETPSGDAVILGEENSRPAAPGSVADAETLADLKTLGLVILGASTFPHYPPSLKLDKEAFKHSAELAKTVLSPAHTVFHKVEVLDLFDQDLRPDEIVDRIEALVERSTDMHDVVLYYCGHGDFLAGREHTYYLALKGTKPGREEYTGLAIKQFRTMIEAKGVLSRRRCTFILDCCYASEAVNAFFQSTGLRGIAFLTASDKDQLARSSGSYKGATLFTGTLGEVLTAEEAGVKLLSLGDLCAAMGKRIKDRQGAIPQCHAPRQMDGDISRIPMFLVGSPASAPIGAREIETQVASNASERNLDIANWHLHFVIMLVFYCLLIISGYALFGRKFDEFRGDGIDVVFWSGALTIYIYIYHLEEFCSTEKEIHCNSFFHYFYSSKRLYLSCNISSISSF